MAKNKTLSACWYVPLACLIALAGCLSVPLGDPDKSTVDDKLVGWWESTPADASADRDLVLMQAYDQRTYLVWFYSYTGAAENITPKGALTFKGWLTQIGKARFLTLQMMNPTVELQPNKEKDRYTVSRLSEAPGGGFILQNVSEDFVKDCATPEALLKKLTDNVDNDALYVAEKSPAYQKADDTRQGCHRGDCEEVQSVRGGPGGEGRGDSGTEGRRDRD